MVTQQTCLQPLRTFDLRLHSFAKSAMIPPRPATTRLLVRKPAQHKVARIGRFQQQMPTGEGYWIVDLDVVRARGSAAAKIGIGHVIPTSEGSLSRHLGWLIRA